jgi:hypothetical protein
MSIETGEGRIKNKDEVNEAHPALGGNGAAPVTQAYRQPLGSRSGCRA